MYFILEQPKSKTNKPNINSQLDKIESVESIVESSLRSSYTSFDNPDESQKESLTLKKKNLMKRKKFGLA